MTYPAVELFIELGLWTFINCKKIQDFYYLGRKRKGGMEGRKANKADGKEGKVVSHHR